MAAAYDLRREQERCHGCGLTPDDAWHVFAAEYRCPTCEDRDTLNDTLTSGKDKREPGLRTRFEYTPHRHTSSAGLFTDAGARYRASLNGDA